jgi:hypothetical protein
LHGKSGKYTQIEKSFDLRKVKSVNKIINMEQDIEQRIWEFIDGHCSASEKEAIEQQLAGNPVWRIKYEELKAVHEMLRQEELEMPSLRFTKNVMEEIAHFQVAPATKNYINKNIVRGIGAFFLVMITGLFVYFIGQIHWSSQATDNLLPSYSVDVNKMNWSRILNDSYLNVFLGITAILGLILADKYMQSRKIVHRPER